MKSLFEYLNFIINGFSNLILLIKFNLRIFLMKGKNDSKDKRNFEVFFTATCTYI